MNQPKVTIRNAIVLEFTLPGVRGSFRSGEGGYRGTGVEEVPTQLERRREHWQIEVDGANAVETRDVLRSLAAQIDIAISEGKFPR